MLVVVGLVVAPFLPAANILFYVGTFIGERLLYMPSAGFCLLLSHAAVKAIGPYGRQCLSNSLQWVDLPSVYQAAGASPDRSQHQGTATAVESDAAPETVGDRTETRDSHSVSSQNEQFHGGASRLKREGQQRRKQQRHQHQQQHQQEHEQQQQQHWEQPAQSGAVPAQFCSRMGLALLALLLLGYSWRTVTRNRDWQDEETLFIAAQKVTLKHDRSLHELSSA